jgi:sporulation protein YlmC with PRC-barrel domain
VASGAVMQSGPQTGQLPPLDPAKIVRGSQLVGQTIVDPRSQKIGVIKDFLVDSQTARVVYLLMAPEGSEANADWIVIPFDDLQLSANAASQPIFILNLQAAQLRAAPHMRSNAWEMLRDPRFIGQVQQFYRPTEYTARRPNGEMNGNGQGTSQLGQTPQSRPGQTPGIPAQGAPAPETRQPATPAGGSTAPGVRPSPQPNEPQNPPKPGLEPEKGKSGPNESNGMQPAPDRPKANANDASGATPQPPAGNEKPSKGTEKATEESSSPRLR